jgi:hypothetical protein
MAGSPTKVRLSLSSSGVGSTVTASFDSRNSVTANGWSPETIKEALAVKATV